MTKKPARRVALCALVLVLVAGLGASILGSRRALPHANSSELTAAAQNLDRLTYELIFRPDNNTLAVTLTWDFANRENVPLDDLVLRFPANAFASAQTSPAASEELYDKSYPDGFSPGGAIVHDVMWQDETAPFVLDEQDNTVLRIETGTLDPGVSGRLYLRTVITIPRALYRFGSTDNLWMLGNALPFPAGRDGAVWKTLPFYSLGDPNTYGLYNVVMTLSLPRDTNCAAPFLWQEDSKSDLKILTGEGLAMRDIALVLGRNMAMHQKSVGATHIVSFADTDDNAAAALKYAEKSLSFYEKTYGEYPRPVYTVAMADLPFDGMEYTGLSMLSKSQYTQKNHLELSIAHDPAHQWFGVLVASNHYTDAWQDEAVCEFAALQYVRKMHGHAAFEQLKFLRADSPMRENIREDITLGSPLDRFHSMQEYATVVYGRGLALLLSLNESIDMNGFLKDYCEQFAFKQATRADFESVLKNYAGWDVAPLMIDYLDTAI